MVWWFFQEERERDEMKQKLDAEATETAEWLKGCNVGVQNEKRSRSKKKKKKK